MSWSEADRELFDVVDRQVAGNPRSGQVAVGPSGLGEPCDRGLLRMLAGVREARRPYEAWKAAAGTALHAYLAEAMEADNRRTGRKRWVVEQKLTVGAYAGRTVRGTCDLYDVDGRVLYDWKTVSASRLRSAKANGASVRHARQAHLYGAGWSALGLPPREVAIVFVPRDGELTSAYVWREPWDSQEARATLRRAADLQVDLDRYGLDGAQVRHDGCAESFCEACRRDRTPRSMFD